MYDQSRAVEYCVYAHHQSQASTARATLGHSQHSTCQGSLSQQYMCTLTLRAHVRKGYLLSLLQI